MAAVTDVVKRLVPASFRAMCSMTNTYYSLSELQDTADYVKLKLLGTSIDAALEATTYDQVLTTFLGKVTTLQFIPAAIDFWGDQLASQSTTGTNESVAYFDRRQELWHRFDELKQEVAAEFDEIAGTYDLIVRGSAAMLPRVSYGDNDRGVLLTPDPQDWPSQERSDNSWDNLIWE